MRIESAGLRLALVFVALTAAPALAQSSSSAPDASFEPQSSVPEELQGMLGDWMLEQEDQSLPNCPITLTDQQVTGGWAIVLPEACPAPYPPADQLAAWTVDESDGSVNLLDPQGKVVIHLLEDEDGLYDTDPTVEPRFYLLPPQDDEGAGGENDAD